RRGGPAGCRSPGTKRGWSRGYSGGPWCPTASTAVSCPARPGRAPLYLAVIGEMGGNGKCVGIERIRGRDGKGHGPNTVPQQEGPPARSASKGRPCLRCGLGVPTDRLPLLSLVPKRRLGTHSPETPFRSCKGWGAKQSFAKARSQTAF